MDMKSAPATFVRQARDSLNPLGFGVSKHAADGMWHRRIVPSQVGETLLNPDTTEVDLEDMDVEILFKKFGNRTVRAVVKYEDGHKIILSVTWRGWLHAQAGKERGSMPA